MKLFRNEVALVGISIVFILLALIFSAQENTSYTVATKSQTEASEYLININTADEDELDMLEGIGPSLAEKIVSYRTKHGPFDNIEELCNVSGVGASTLEKFKDFIKV